jgi:NAD(P)H-flavin reductase
LLAEVEVLTRDRAKEVFAWADYLAAVAKLSEVNAVASDLKVFRNHINRTGEDQLLVLADMPCTGIAACEMCTVQTKKGWKHACKDGPVFNLAEMGPA